jgi:hypothetical protein
MSKGNKKSGTKKYFLSAFFVLVVGIALTYLVSDAETFELTYDMTKTAPPVLDVLAYNKKMIELAGYGTTTLATGIIATSSAWTATTSSISSPLHPWPAKTIYPNVGAILPFNRIVAYYGNFYSAAMGILGQYPTDVVIQKLKDVVSEWRAADPTTPVIPAIDYIVVTAQGTPGADSKYRLRMPADQIEKAIAFADSIHGLVFLDVQPGQSDVQTEIPLLAQYLKLPEVELAIDPEFSMKTGKAPGTIIGTMDASDVNYAARYLANIVRENNLAPKMLLVHRFTEEMVTDYKKIAPLPEVEIIMNMDGWSTPAKKIKVYNEVVSDEPVQFTGIKLFYKNDALPPSSGLLTPAQILGLHAAPSFVEYQ